MRSLLLKDLRLVAQFAWWVLPAHLLWCVQSFLVPEYHFWANLVAALAWPIAVAAIEWRFEADRVLASLPVTRATIVRARYASALAGVALGAALYALYGHLVTSATTSPLVERGPGTAAWSSLDGIVAFLFVGYLLVLLFLPLMHRFGLPVGVTLLGVSASMAVLAVVGLGRLARSAGGLAGPSMGPWLPSEIIRGWLSSVVVAWGLLPATLILIASAGVTGALSLWLSVRFYERREL